MTNTQQSLLELGKDRKSDRRWFQFGLALATAGITAILTILIKG